MGANIERFFPKKYNIKKIRKKEHGIRLKNLSLYFFTFFIFPLKSHILSSYPFLFDIVYYPLIHTPNKLPKWYKEENGKTQHAEGNATKK